MNTSKALAECQNDTSKKSSKKFKKSLDKPLMLAYIRIRLRKGQAKMTKPLPIKPLKNERVMFDIWNIVGSNKIRVCLSDSARGRKTVNVWSYYQYGAADEFQAGEERDRVRMVKQQTFETPDAAYEYVRLCRASLEKSFYDRTSHLNKQWENVD